MDFRRQFREVVWQTSLKINNLGEHIKRYTWKPSKMNVSEFSVSFFWTKKKLLTSYFLRSSFRVVATKNSP